VIEPRVGGSALQILRYRVVLGEELFGSQYGFTNLKGLELRGRLNEPLAVEVGCPRTADVHVTAAIGGAGRAGAWTPNLGLCCYESNSPFLLRIRSLKSFSDWESDAVTILECSHVTPPAAEQCNEAGTKSPPVPSAAVSRDMEARCPVLWRRNGGYQRGE
jgi:hypothetical protein